MAAAPAMDQRLSVSKSSSSRIRKSSSGVRRLGLPSSSPPRPSSSRPPPTVVNADLTDFRRVVQQLTGTPPPSTSPSPVRDSSKPSRLQRIAPPPLRSRQRNQQFFQQHKQSHQAAPYHDLNHPQEHYYQYMQQDIIDVHNGIQPQQNPTLCLPPPPHPNPTLPVISPRLTSSLSAPTPGDNTWTTPFNGIASPRHLSNCASVLPSPLFPSRAENLARYGDRDMMDPFSPSGRLYLHSSSHGTVHPHTASSLNPHFSSSYGFSPSSKHFLHSPTSYGQAALLPISSHDGLSVPISPSNAQFRPPHPPYAHLLPPLPSPAALPPISPYPASYSPTTSFPWLPPWPPSPFLSPLPLSPSLFPRSPGLRPFAGSPTGFSFQPANDHKTS